MSLKNLKNGFKSLINKGNKDKTNTDSTEESRVKEIKKEKFANAIAKQLKASIGKDKDYIETIKDIGHALISLPPNFKDDKYGFVDCTDQDDVQNLLKNATKGNQPKKTDISRHHLYALRKGILKVFQSENIDSVIKKLAYYDELAKLFESAAKHGADHKRFRPLIGYTSLQNALSDIGNSISVFRLKAKDGIALCDQRYLYKKITEYIGEFEKNMCSLFKRQDKSQQNSNKEILELKNILEDLKEKAKALKEEN